MSNKSSSAPVRHRTLSRLAAVGGTALILSSLVMTFAASAVSAADPEPPIGDLIAGTKNPDLTGDVCKAGNFNFVVDMSGSIGQQGSIPSNLPDLKAGIIDFVDAFNAVPDTHGKYAGVKFNGSTAGRFTLVDGYVESGPFVTAVGTLTNPNGLTPTALGIDTGKDNNNNPISGAPKVMFVLTDGSPNVPNTHGDDLTNVDTWVQGANAAIAAANAARTAGYSVQAVYLTADGDPGDVNLPFSNPAGDTLWATTVMNKIGGGSHFEGDFDSFLKELFDAIDCPLPLTDISTEASGNIDLGGEVWDVAKLSGGKEPGGKITFNLYGPDDDNCNGEVAFTYDKNVDGNGNYTSGKFTPTKVGTYHWIATYSGDNNNAGAEGACGDDNEDVTVTKPKVPDINVEKLVGNGDDSFHHTLSAQPGDELSYRITVHNVGDATATGVVVTDDITASLAHADYNNDCSPAVCSLEAGDVLTWAPVDIAAGATKTFTFSVELDDSFPDGTTTLPNAVVVVGPGSNCPAGDYVPLTQQEPNACETETNVNAYLLTIAKDNDAPLQPLELPNEEIIDVHTANEGDTVTYTLKYHVGDLAVSNGVITDVLPDGVEYIADSATTDGQFTEVSFANGKLTWKAEGVSEDGTLTYKGKIAAGANELEQPLINNATIVSEQTDPDDASSDVYVPAEVGAETSNPTPPQTDAFGADGAGGPGVSLPLILAVLGVLILGLAFLTPVPAAVRRRNRR